MPRAQSGQRLLRLFDVLLRGEVALFQPLAVRFGSAALFIDVLYIIVDLRPFKRRFLQLCVRIIRIFADDIQLFLLRRKLHILFVERFGSRFHRSVCAAE